MAGFVPPGVPFERDHYKVLGLPRTASQEEIRERYREMILKFHPDRNESSNANEILKRLAESYAVLSDPENRRAFDLRSRPKPEPAPRNTPAQRERPPKDPEHGTREVPRFSVRRRVAMSVLFMIGVCSFAMLILLA